MRLLNTSLITALLLLMGWSVMAQVSGVVYDKETNSPLIGATVFVPGTSIGTSTNVDGSFKLNNGGKTINIAMVGYTKNVVENAKGNLGTIQLESNSLSLNQILVVANAATDRKTPVALSTIKSKDIQNFSGNKEFPQLMKFTPSTYVSNEGGGFGDSRINVRGYGQENVGVMINGVPVNDMENGAVYWSNWAGLSDVANQIQIQRGLGASRVSNSAIGGTINIITKTAEREKGGSVFAGLGNNGMIEGGVSYNTGKMKNGLAISALTKYTQGKGYIDGTDFQGGTYFLSIAKEINKHHTLQLTGTGAPQWHYQNYGNAYSTIYGDSAGNGGYGRRYNSYWGKLDGDNYSMAKNYYHKPIIFLNHFWTINHKSSLSTTFYYSQGRGGGTGSFGKINGTSYYKLTTADHTVDFDNIKKWNSGGTVSSFGDNLATWSTAGDFAGDYVVTSSSGITRYASVNNHNWEGLVSTYQNQLSDNLHLLAGVDLRWYKGIHYRVINDLLGADAYYETNNVNIADGYYATNDKTHVSRDYYSNENQLGGFATMEYTKDKLSAQVTATVNNVSYKRTELMYQSIASDTNVSPKKNFLGFNFKGGANYNLDRHNNVFFNVGYFQRAPFLTTVFRSSYDKYGNLLNGDPKNEKILAFELGYGFNMKNVNVKLNLYSTSWKDRALNKTTTLDGNPYNQVLQGVNALNQGVELEVNTTPISKLNVRGMLSVGSWKYTSDANSYFYNGLTGQLNDTLSGKVHIKDVKIGNAAQTTLSIFAEYEVINNLYVNASYNYYANLYADFSPFDRVSSDTTARQAWKLPNYGLMDAGLRYVLNLKGSKALTFKLGISNLFNKEYLSGSSTDKAYYKADGVTQATTGTYLIPNSTNGSSANTVYVGLGTTWYFGLKFDF